MQLTTIDLTDFSSVPAKWRVRVDAWLKTLQQLDAGTLRKADAIAALRVSRATFDRKLAAVREFGWRGLVPNYQSPTTLPAAFVDH